MSNETGINRKHLIHKAVELHKLSGAFRKRHPDVQSLFDSGYVAQPKLDGVNAFAIIDMGAANLYSRTGDSILSCSHVESELLACFGSCVVLGELWHPRLPQNEISGLARRHEPSPALEFHAFDLIPLPDFFYGNCSAAYGRRHGNLYDVIANCRPRNVRVVPYEFDLCGRPVMEVAKSMRQFGCDGLILRDPEAPWIAGAGLGGEIVKAKPLLTFDLKCVGTFPGAGKYLGMTGGLLFRWRDGRELRVGTGLTDADRAASPESWHGRIFEISGMDYSADGLLREPRLGAERFDKESPDF